VYAVPLPLHSAYVSIRAYTTTFCLGQKQGGIGHLGQYTHPVRVTHLRYCSQVDNTLQSRWRHIKLSTNVTNLLLENVL